MDEAKLWVLQATRLKASPLNTRKIVREAFIQDRCLPHLNSSVVNLLCILCSRIRTYRELLMIFFHDKHWYRSEPLFSVEEEEEEEEEDIDVAEDRVNEPSSPSRSTSPSPSQTTITSVQPPSLAKKPEYEFLLFNYLLRFVHREGQIGEFARAGLIFLMDIAMSSGESGTGPSRDEKLHSPDTPISDPINDAALALAEYILDGDFSEVLGAGLGAVYSLLPSKLGFFPQTSSDPSSNTMTIGSTGMETEDENEQLMALKDRNRAMGIEDAQNSDFKSRLDHFLKLLEFLQDVLRRNVSHDSVDASALVGTAIVQSILDAVRRIFLENVLYPSILECSDADGSAVAVMSYIEIMIRTLQPGPLSSLLVNFLIDEDNDEPRHRQRPHTMLNLGSIPPQTGSSHEGNSKHRRRKSSAMVLLEMEAPESRKQSEYFTSMGRFTLRDLLLSNLRSKSQATATSALQLLQSMLVYHPELTVARLLLVIPDPMATAFPCPILLEQRRESTHLFESAEEDDEESFRYPEGEKEDETRFFSSMNDSMFSQPDTTYSTHEREMGLYLTLISRVDSSHTNDGFSTGYDHYLRDALISIQSQPVYWLACRNSNKAASTRPLKHRLNPNDPVLSRLLESMRVFFSNTPDFNITLTGVLATLAIHPNRSLAGWLTLAHDDTSSDVQSAVQDVEDDDGDDRSIDFLIEEKLANDTIYLPAASMDDSSRPVLYTIFHGLINQLERYRQLVDDFDKFLLERRQGLLFSENLTDALHLSVDIVDESKPVQPTSDITPKAKPKPPKASTSSFVSFLTPKKSKLVRPPQPEPSTPQKVPSKNIPASPFGTHYLQTGSISVEPFVAPIPYTGLWTPAKVTKWNAVEEDVFGSGWVEKKKDEWEAGENEDDGNKAGTTVRVTLSQLLDNVVILEESIKELVAIIHGRRSLGIDHLRYL